MRIHLPLPLLACLFLLFSSTFLKAQTYCPPPLPTNPCENGVIGDFTFANIIKPGTSCDPATQGYSENLSDTAFLVPNEVYTASLTAGSALLFDIYYMFIDWNLDYEFSEDERIQFVGVNDGDISGAANIYQAIITVPPTAVTDSIGRFRVFGSWLEDDNLRGCNDNLLGDYLYGEVEDYHFIVTATPPSSSGPYCDADGGINCSNGTATTFIDTVICQEDAPTQPLKQDAYTNGTGCDSYADYTQNLSLVAKWSIGQTYQVSVNINNDTLTNFAAIYVDLNNDQDFSTEEEFDLLYLLGQPRTALITVPPGSATGTFVRMRIRVNGDLSIAPCGALDYGEVEDYNVLISPLLSSSPLCVEKITPAPGATDVCSNTQLSWFGDSDAEGYLVTLVSESGDIIYNQFNTTDTTLSLPADLMADSVYYWGISPYTADDTVKGCDIDTFRVAPKLAPQINLTPTSPANACINNITQLNGNPTEGNITGDYMHSWNGTDNTKLSDTAIVNPIFTSSALGVDTLSYTVTDDLGCFNTDTLYIETTNGPSLDTFYIAPAIICETESATLTAIGDYTNITIEDSISGGTWTPLAYISTSDSTYLIDSLTAGDHLLRIRINAGSCVVVSGYNQLISVNPTPNQPVVSVSSTSICAGDELPLVVTNYTDDLTWNDVSSTNNDTLIVFSNGSYFVNYIDPVTGCSSNSDTVNISVNAIPAKPSIDAPDGTVFCSTKPFFLITTNYQDNITWTDDLGTVNDSLSLAGVGEYAATFIDPVTGCSSTSDTIVVTQFDTLPEVIEVSTNVLGSSISGDSYRWFLDGVELAQTTQNIDVTEDGTYTVIVTINGCESTVSEDFPYIVEGIQQINAVTFNVFPNPTTGSFTIDQIPAAYKVLSVYSVSGKLVYQADVHHATKIQVQLNIESGYYQIELSGELGRMIAPLIVH